MDLSGGGLVGSEGRWCFLSLDSGTAVDSGDITADSDDGGGGSDSGDGAGSDGETVVTYPGPDGVAKGTCYAVSVEQSGVEYPSFVYEVNRQQETNLSWLVPSCSTDTA